jgi:hypothetical protein
MSSLPILTNEDKGESNDEGNAVCIERIVVLSESFPKYPDVRIQVIFAESLK